jgi:hypothetical protein
MATRLRNTVYVPAPCGVARVVQCCEGVAASLHALSSLQTPSALSVHSALARTRDAIEEARAAMLALLSQETSGGTAMPTTGPTLERSTPEALVKLFRQLITVLKNTMCVTEMAPRLPVAVVDITVRKLYAMMDVDVTDRYLQLLDAFAMRYRVPSDDIRHAQSRRRTTTGRERVRHTAASTATTTTMMGSTVPDLPTVAGGGGPMPPPAPRKPRIVASETGADKDDCAVHAAAAGGSNGWSADMVGGGGGANLVVAYVLLALNRLDPRGLGPATGAAIVRDPSQWPDRGSDSVGDQGIEWCASLRLAFRPFCDATATATAPQTQAPAPWGRPVEPTYVPAVGVCTAGGGPPHIDEDTFVVDMGSVQDRAGEYAPLCVTGILTALKVPELRLCYAEINMSMRAVPTLPRVRGMRPALAPPGVGLVTPRYGRVYASHRRLVPDVWEAGYGDHLPSIGVHYIMVCLSRYARVWPQQIDAVAMGVDGFMPITSWGGRGASFQRSQCASDVANLALAFAADLRLTTGDRERVSNVACSLQSIADDQDMSDQCKHVAMTSVLMDRSQMNPVYEHFMPAGTIVGDATYDHGGNIFTLPVDRSTLDQNYMAALFADDSLCNGDDYHDVNDGMALCDDAAMFDCGGGVGAPADYMPSTPPLMMGV